MNDGSIRRGMQPHRGNGFREERRAGGHELRAGLAWRIAGVGLLLAAFGAGQAGAQIGAHALPTASRAGDLQIGGGVALGSSNYNFISSRLVGGVAYTTFDIRPHLGAEFSFRQNKSTTDSTVYERTYEIGPRIYVLKGRFEPYAKALYGRGVYNFSNNVANIAYNIYTLGGGADYRVTRSLNVRVDYEYQTWPGFPLATLHPSVITLGVAYHFHE
jgi:opacity protein-like surface antigen